MTPSSLYVTVESTTPSLWWKATGPMHGGISDKLVTASNIQ